MRIRSTERRRAATSSSPAVSSPPGFTQNAGNAALQEQLNRAPATPVSALTRQERPPSRLSDAEQVAQSIATAEAARTDAGQRRAVLDAKLATMEQKAAPHLQCKTAAFHTLRNELSGSLPQSIAPKSEIVERMGFPEGEVGGVNSRVLRQAADPSRPQLVAYASEKGQDALQEKLEGFESQRTRGEIGRAVSGLLGGKLGLGGREVIPAMSVLFDASSLDDGIAEANGQLSGEKAKDLMAGVATAEALQKAKGKHRRLNKAVTGRGFGGRIANRVFQNSLPDARAQVRREGAQSQRQVSDYVVHEGRAQLLTQKAAVEGQMVDNKLALDKVGLGAVFDRKDTHLDPDTLNLFMQTEEGRKFWLEDIGGESSYAEADQLEAATSPLHAKGELTNAALAQASMKHGLYPTAEGSFVRLPPDASRQQKAAMKARLQAAYTESKGQPLPGSALRELMRQDGE